MDLVSLHVDRVEGLPTLAWSEGHVVRMPAVVAKSLTDSAGPPASITLTPEVLTRLDRTALLTAHQDLRMLRLYTDIKPVSSRLPIPYTKVPGWARRVMAKGVGRLQRTRVNRWAAYPGWPVDLSADFAADLAGIATWRVPEGRLTPVLLSHDLDTAEGLNNAVRMFLKIEEAVGARSSNFIVPRRWSVDLGQLDELAARGHEVGVHGYDHTNRTAFTDPDDRCQRLAAAQYLFDRYDIAGYRAPSLLRTQGLLQDLGRHYRYDSSVPTAGGLFPVPNNGCASARPFKLAGLWEIPLTMPRDGSLRFLGHSPAEILTLWISCAESIAASGGIVSVLNHCEAGFSGNKPMLDIYQRFLAFLADSGRFSFMTGRQVADQLDQTP